MVKTRRGRTRPGRAAIRTGPALLLVTAALGLAACGGGQGQASLSTSPTIAPPSAPDLATVRSAATRTLGTRVSASIVLEATQVFGAGQPDVTGTGTFDLSEGTWRNDTTGKSGTVPKLPALILDIIESGGVMPRLAAQGYLPAELGDLLRSSSVAMRGAGSGA